MTSSDTGSIARLAKLDACAISDALDRLGLSGAVPGLSAMTSARRVCGNVMTVKLERADMAPTGQPRPHLATSAIEAAQPRDVIVIEQRTGVDAACWGGTLSLAAQLRDLAGVIADGAVRDIDEARAMDFPIFARGATARAARGRIAEASWGAPVTICDVMVRSGDFVVADSTAVVFVPAERIGEVLDAAETIVAREALMAEALRSGQPVSQVMGAAYEDLLKRGSVA